MWRYVWSAVLVVGLGLFVLTGSPKHKGAPGPEVYSVKQETGSKMTLVQQDVRLTDELCRSQCSFDLRSMVARIEAGQPAREVLAAMRHHHEKMDMLVWSQRGQKLEQGVKEGQVLSDYAADTNRYVQEAKAAADAGKSYQSPAFGQGNQTYFVLAQPSALAAGSLIGVIHQDVLSQVEEHQKKNLRLAPYPAEKSWKIESVDTDTLQDKVVDHPEDNQGTSHYHPNEVVVRFKKDPTDSELNRIKSEIGSRTVRKLGYTYVFTADGMEAKQLMAYFKKWDVSYVEPHFLYLTNDAAASSGKAPGETNGRNDVTANFIPNDYLFSRYQWNLPTIETVQGWQTTRGAQDVIVGVVDTGVDLQHPDLQGQLVPGYNVVGNNDVPQDDVGHGTHVAGVIAAVVNNNVGVAGMSWYNKVLPVKVLDQSGAGSTYAVAQGVIWATDHGAKVINMSLGNYADSSFLHDAIKYAFDHDVALIAASGNDNTDRPGFPAAYPEVFAVAATDAQNQKAPFSNYGDYIDVAAPGVSIASTYPNNQYAALSGTSMASPHVTALAALIRSVNPLLKNTEVYDIIRQTAQDLGDKGRDAYYGYGLIDVDKAVKAASAAATSLNYWPQNTAREMNRLQRQYAPAS
ncbi:peptidase S8 [Paenibacillus athensensis]|uniref:Peptidase S8 n=1 Tax=Paenibacillus athensensis TaxID=1967502 RepID=A0A4Y8PSY4_9BACL|nr:S8 family peptidase [Paenibacillus athensensis]MCD1261555.1 peptidase S8 [Paenibacillus athensensis]